MNGLSNTRQKGETFEEYKLRRKNLNHAIKHRLRGRVVWHSEYQGTFKHANV